MPPTPLHHLQGRIHHPTVMILLCIVALLLFAYSSLLDNESSEPSRGIMVTDILGDDDLSGYARAYLPREFSFPADHGPHPDYKHEWWYFTGNIDTETGRRFGYQLTFFRFALGPRTVERDSNWAATQMMMAHFALSDIEADKFHHFEKTSRAALELAGATAQPFRIWIDNWSADGTVGDTWPLKLHAVQDDVELDISLVPARPVVLQGDEGLSRKSKEAGNASYYYSLTRLQTHGLLRVGGEQYKVSGLSWLDREWGTSSLASDQSGWDWFALQLSDGTDLMLYRLRRKDGSIDSFSSGTVVDDKGSARPLTAQDFSIRILGQWQSPHTHIRYPARWRLAVPNEALDVEIKPLLDDQELHASLNYWEGAVGFHGTHQNNTISGYGYVELTGYDETGTHDMTN